MPDTIKHITPRLDSTIAPVKQDTVAKIAISQSAESDSTAKTIKLKNDSIAHDSIPKQKRELKVKKQDVEYTDSVCICPADFEIIVEEQIQTIAKIEPYNALPRDLYGPYTTKHSEPFSALTVGEGKITHTPLKTTWLDILSVGLIIYFVLILAFTWRFIISLPSLLFNQQKAHKQFEEDSQFYTYSRRMYIAPSIIIFSVFLFFGGIRFDLLPNNISLFESFIYILTLIIAVSVLKQITLWLIGFVTLSHNFILELLFNRQIFFIAATILLFPIAVLLPLYHDIAAQNLLLITGAILIIITFISMLVRTLMVFRMARISHFFWILYLCILEIAPYLVLCLLFQ